MILLAERHHRLTPPSLTQMASIEQRMGAAGDFNGVYNQRFRRK